MAKEKNVFDRAKIERKLKLASDLFEMAFEQKRFLLRQKYPDLTEQELIQRAYMHKKIKADF